MDVPARFEEVPVLLDQMALETALEQVTRTAMPPVEVARVAAIEILHACGEVGFRRLQKEVVVIPHQRECVQPPVVRLDRPPQPLQPFLAVPIVPGNRPSLVPAGHHVIQRAGKLDPQGSGHANRIPRPGSLSETCQPSTIVGLDAGRRSRVGANWEMSTKKDLNQCHILAEPHVADFYRVWA
jgi:hypothetical protein